MVEKPVRNSEFCISCTMPERLAFITSRSTASMGMATASAVAPSPPLAGESRRGGSRLLSACGFPPPPPPPPRRREGVRAHALWPRSFLLRHDQILPLIHPRDLSRADHRRAIELVEHCRTHELQPHVELLALIHWTFDRCPVDPHPPRRALRIGQPR